ncbi:calaxin [Diorhabda carinulata]|uniref:calaxin n=1 Tax=Diorhabda carinulata TaxID=1163345 RepID=UPI0025A2B79F|nr:calaxin [Diorhabda carinulata]
MSNKQAQQFPAPGKKLSMRGGVFAIKGVSFFLAAAKTPKTSNQPSRSSDGKGRGRKKMNDKDICKCSAKVMEATKRDTLLNRKEIDALYRIYKKLIAFNKITPQGAISQNVNAAAIIGKPPTATEGIDRTVFREVMHNTFDIVTEYMLMDRIFCVWDKQNYGLITVENWFKGLSLFLKGNIQDQINYCFAVYDLNSDGFITKDEMFQLLRNCLIKHPQEEDPDESVKDLVDIVMRKIDKDKDGKVCLEDFRVTVREEPLLLEAFGRCLPSEESKMTFLTTLKT